MRLKQKNNLIHRFLYLGIDANTSFIDAQKMYMFNLFILTCSPFAIFSLVYNVVNQAYFPAWINMMQISLFATALWISVNRTYLQLRVVILMALFTLAIIAAYSYKNMGEYRLLIMIIAAVVLFDKVWQYLLFALLAITVFVYIRMTEMATSQAWSPSDSIVTGAKIFFPLLLFVLSLLYFKIIYFKNLAELEKANQALSIAKRQKENILNTIVHDLRSPITNVGGVCKLLLSGEVAEVKQKEFIHMIDRSAQSAMVLINDLLHSSDSNIHEGLLVAGDMNHLLEKCMPSLQLKSSEKDIAINLSLTEEKLYVLMDADRMERVLSNLINNAVKFSKEGSTILITAHREVDEAVLAIADQGIGIARDKQAAIFDMFTAAKRNGTAGEKSFGMGLSICKQIVEQHHGCIMVESEEEKGSTFIIRLPLKKV